jgi:cytochrome bd-type quinol oxidase subunit 1/mono/diheme cytochrome c family protein
VNYPVWDLAMGGGLLIAIVSILHVFVSHFAIGGGLWLVVTETHANRRGDRELRDFVKSHARFFILLTLVFGAITGVGIWFTIGLVSPDSVSALIHAFLWGWALEWIFFVVEIAAAMVYYYGWDRLDARTHEIVGWIYFGAAWLSLLLINGIITFMLTPGRWLDNQSFGDGFFNPTFWPSLALRTCAAIALAGILTLVTATALPRSSLRRRLTRYNGAWVVVGLVLGIAAALWYKSVFPSWGESSAGAVPIFGTMLAILPLSALAVLVAALWAVLLPWSWNRAGVALLLIAGLVTFGAGEWIRESGRKPYTINKYIYSNGLLVSDEKTIEANGVLSHTRWIDPDALGDQVALGRELFRAHCRVCHTLDGYNGLRPYLARWNQETVASLLPHLEVLRARMPPWYGHAAENEAVTAYLLGEGRRGQRPWPTSPTAAQTEAWKVSCGLCHTLDGYRPLRLTLKGMTRQDLDELLEMSGELVETMPAYHGDVHQRELLLDFLEAVAGVQAPDAAALSGRTDTRPADRRSTP